LPGNVSLPKPSASGAALEWVGISLDSRPVVRQKSIRFTLCRDALISMMQAAKRRLLDNDATIHYLAFHWTVFVESEMRAGSMVIPEVGSQRLL
jgi:hypothetical protein